MLAASLGDKMLDRNEQLELLRALADEFPNSPRMLGGFAGLDEKRLAWNLAYLQEHALVDVHWAQIVRYERTPTNAKITATGLEFLADDGGLTAIVGVVTVRLHEDSIKALLIDRVQRSTAPETVKSKVVSQIRALPAEALKAVTLEGLKAGLDLVPDAAAWLQSVLAP